MSASWVALAAARVRVVSPRLGDVGDEGCCAVPDHGLILAPNVRVRETGCRTLRTIQGRIRRYAPNKAGHHLQASFAIPSLQRDS